MGDVDSEILLAREKLKQRLGGGAVRFPQARGARRNVVARSHHSDAANGLGSMPCEGPGERGPGRPASRQ